MSSTFQSYPVTWIKIWIGIGVLGFVFMLMIPVTLGQHVLREQQRFLACRNGTRTDCQSSAVWAMSGWQLESASSTGETPLNSATSSTAPIISSLTLEHATFENDYYRVSLNTSVKILATVSGAKTAVAYLIPAGGISKSIPLRVATLRAQDTTGKGESVYVGSFKILSKTFVNGELEIRAKNAKGETSSMFLKIAAQ